MHLYVSRPPVLLLSSSCPPPYLLSIRLGSFRYVTSAEPQIRVLGGERGVEIERGGGEERSLLPGTSCLTAMIGKLVSYSTCPPSDKGDFVGRDNGPIAKVSGNREQRKVLSTGNKGRSKAL